MSVKRKQYKSHFKAQVAMAALQERETLAQIARRFNIHPVQVSQWRKQLADNADAAFESDGSESQAAREQEDLLKKIGELTMERDFLSRGLRRSR
jgi:transposase-like protein